ncbi:glycoside hydrolase family 76 protein [Lentithecium fluviatile CBS 122367]|uniref:Mannan endo-1,6-alpha-mannosidase n=1 Tax=Lentithecium fluviatile CBS 122367 TaxID=1168545 RepID=A0A6G1IRL1_9PLEO|nr:glycoside hydrolase family 76 protein [Lentithecium fluviatile CBS 122367]
MRVSGAAQAWSVLTLLSAIFSSSVLAIQLDPTTPDSVRTTAKHVAEVLVSMYKNPQTGALHSGIPGLLQYPPYYWWEAGAMFGQLIDYWYYTGDSTYNDMVKEAILHQSWGIGQNFMPANQSKDLGNDDQLFWAFTVMSAAEYNFPNPPSEQLGWLGMAQSIFNQLAGRWDNETCRGGIRWQIHPHLPGFDYKNMASNGGYFQLGARLALYTGNDTYAQKAEEMFDWLEYTSPLISQDFQVFDGSDVLKADHTQWSYNYGIMIGGAAYMYNYTSGAQHWRDRLQGFINHTDTFFQPKYGQVMMELCEIEQKCDVDQVSFKGYLARWYAVAVQLAPFTAPQLVPHLRKSGVAAAQACVGTCKTSSQPYACGNRWYWDGYDGNGGAGQQLAALSVISANLITESGPILRNSTGGTSKGDPGAGNDDNENLPIYDDHAITTGDRAGAVMLTLLLVGNTVLGAWYLLN